MKRAKETLLKHRSGVTPVLLAKNLGRTNETLLYRKLEDLRVDEGDMLTVVIVGSSNSKIVELGGGSRMYTPRGYARKIDGDLA